MKDIDKVTETNKDNKKSIKTLVVTILLTCLVTETSTQFVLRKYNTKNIFNDKNLKISEAEADDLFQILKDESGNDNFENERDLILIAAIDNPNLTESEKETVFKLVDLIEEMPYINKRVAYANLKKLDIVYYNEVINNRFGDYNYLDNQINIYYDNQNNDVLLHELIHSLFLNLDTTKLPEYLREGVTELLEDEYFSDTPYLEDTSYAYEIAMVKILCDMVGSDLVLKAYTKGDMKIIENELALYMGKEKAKSYLKNVEAMFEEYSEKNTVSLDYLSSFLADTNEFFSKRYLESNEVFDSYEYNKELLINLKSNDPGLKYVEYLSNNGYYVKPYFSKKLKEEDKKHYQKKIEGTLTVQKINNK